MCCVAPAYVAATFLAGLMFSVYMRYTFLVEHTWLADTVRPMNRRSCALPIFNTSTAVRTNILSPAVQGMYKIGVIMMYESMDNSSKAWSDDMLQPLIDVRGAYCKRHGYALLDANHLIDSSRPAAWFKLLALEHYLRSGQYDYLFYLDMDTLIMNPSIRLETFIAASAGQFDLVATEDMNGLNTGAFLIRNSPWSLWFLRTAWEQAQLVAGASADGTAHLFRWEQRSFHYLMNSPQWQAAGLPEYSGDYREIRSHFYILPQCAFNSYILHPFDLHAVREDSQYAPGDFLIHFAGKNGDSKRQLMKYYLQQLHSSTEGGSARRGRLR